MTLTLFITLLTILALVSSLITEAIKKVYKATKPTLVDAIISAVAGWGGGIVAYILMGIPFSAANVVCVILLAPAIWLCSTLGYDKVVEVITQIGLMAKE